MELDRANDEIQRLRKLLKRPSDGESELSNCSTGSSHFFEFENSELHRQNLHDSAYSSKPFNINESYHVFSSSS